MTRTFDCREVERFIDAFIDGEFALEERALMEQHLADCGPCARSVRVQVGFKAALKAALPTPPYPAELTQRVRRALAREEQEIHPRPLARWLRLGYVAMPAAAAAFLVGLFISYRPEVAEPVLSEAIAKHQRNLPVEVAGSAAEVRAWFTNKVDFAVRPPQLANAALVGGRLANVGDRPAAYLVYDVGGGEKMSVLLFDPKDVSLTGTRRQVVGNHEIFVDGERGYHAAAFRDQGLGYVFTSAMDEDRMLELVSTAVRR